MKKRKNIKWTDEMIREKALQYSTRGEFQKSDPKAYKVCLRRGLLDECCSHMTTLQINWTDSMIHEEALKYTSRVSFIKGSPKAYYASLKSKNHEENCSHMNGNVYWSKKMIHEEALKYNRKCDFQKNSRNAYNASLRSGKHDIYCSHMTPVFFWSDENILEEALKYKSRKEFSKCSVGAYGAAIKKGILNEVSKHMKLPKHYSKSHCVYLIEFINKDDSRYYYVGQTSNMTQRMYLHIGGWKQTPVYSHLQTPEWNRMKLRILWKDLSFEDSLKLEQKTIDKFIKNNMNLLNKDGVTNV